MQLFFIKYTLHEYPLCAHEVHSYVYTQLPNMDWSILNIHWELSTQIHNYSSLQVRSNKRYSSIKCVYLGVNMNKYNIVFELYHNHLATHLTFYITLATTGNTTAGIGDNF